MITFDVNNCGKVTLEQKTHDKSVIVTHGNGNITTISPGDFIMLLNMYNYIKNNDIQSDFINPYGKNTEDKTAL